MTENKKRIKEMDILLASHPQFTPGTHPHDQGSVDQASTLSWLLSVGFIVIEGGSGTIGGVAYEAALGADSVRGVTNAPPYAYTFGTSFATAPTVALNTMAAVDGGNGGWSYTYGPTMATTTVLNLVIDEDQAGDSERAHTTEQVGYMVFETAAVYP